MDVVERLKTRAEGFAGFSREAWAREDNHSEQRGSESWVWDKPRMGWRIYRNGYSFMEYGAD